MPLLFYLYYVLFAIVTLSQPSRPERFLYRWTAGHVLSVSSPPLSGQTTQSGVRQRMRHKDYCQAHVRQRMRCVRYTVSAPNHTQGHRSTRGDVQVPSQPNTLFEPECRQTTVMPQQQPLRKPRQPHPDTRLQHPTRKRCVSPHCRIDLLSQAHAVFVYPRTLWKSKDDIAQPATHRMSHMSEQ